MKLKEQLLRWTLIVRKIQNNPGISFEELQRTIMQELYTRGYDSVCSDSTLKRDIKELRKEFNLDIKYNRSTGGYELKQLKKNWLDVDCIIEPFELITAFDNREEIPEWIFIEKYNSGGTRHLSYIIKAIKQKLKIEFSYKKYSDNSISQRKLSPYAIKQCNGRWYVIGMEENGSMKTFGMDRMKDLTISHENFIKDESFDIEDKFKYSYGIYSSDEYPLEDILISCSKEDANYLESRPIHCSQKIISDDRNNVTISFRLRITPDFIMEIVSRSWSVKIIKPEYLRKQICNIYRDALARNNE